MASSSQVFVARGGFGPNHRPILFALRRSFRYGDDLASSVLDFLYVLRDTYDTRLCVRSTEYVEFSVGVINHENVHMIFVEVVAAATRSLAPAVSFV